MKTWKIEYLLDDDGVGDDAAKAEDYLSDSDIRNEIGQRMCAGLTIRELKVEEVER